MTIRQTTVTDLTNRYIDGSRVYPIVLMIGSHKMKCVEQNYHLYDNLYKYRFSVRSHSAPRAYTQRYLQMYLEITEEECEWIY